MSLRKPVKYICLYSSSESPQGSSYPLFIDNQLADRGSSWPFEVLRADHKVLHGNRRVSKYIRLSAVQDFVKET